MVLGPCPAVEGDLRGHTATLHGAPGLDLTGPVGVIEYHTLARFYTLKTQDKLQPLKCA